MKVETSVMCENNGVTVNKTGKHTQHITVTTGSVTKLAAAASAVDTVNVNLFENGKLGNDQFEMLIVS